MRHIDIDDNCNDILVIMSYPVLHPKVSEIQYCLVVFSTISITLTHNLNNSYNTDPGKMNGSSSSDGFGPNAVLELPILRDIIFGPSKYLSHQAITKL